MRFKGRMELEHGLKPIDIAPVINVIFLLLMFFMITPSFTTDSAITVNLPKVATSEAVNYGDTQLVVSADNRIFLDGSIVTLDELKGRFKAMAKRNLAILIKADSRANLGKVVEIWDTCKLMGIKQISIATGQQ